MSYKLLLSTFLLMIMPLSAEELRISRSSSVEVVADKARITLAIEAQGDEPEIVEKKLSYIQYKVSEALESEPLSDFTVFGFNLYPTYEPKTSKISHYNGRVNIAFICDIKEGGKIIQKALENGANRSYGMEVFAQEDHLNNGRKEALIKAYNECLSEAHALLNSINASDIKVKEVYVVPGGSYHPMAKEFSLMADRSTGVEYSEQRQKISIQVELAIEYSI